MTNAIPNEVELSTLEKRLPVGGAVGVVEKLEGSGIGEPRGGIVGRTSAVGEGTVIVRVLTRVGTVPGPCGLPPLAQAPA